MAKYFGTNGIRGKLDLITPEFASRMAAAFGSWIGGGKILVARDTRTSGEMLESAVVAGLISAGCEPVVLGIAPAPTVEYAVLNLKANGAINVTASHNPPEWNALKFVDGKGIAVSQERGVEIEKIFEASSAKKAPWDQMKKVSHYSSACSDHAKTVRAKLDTSLLKKRKLSIVLDCANGTVGLIAPEFFKSLGCRVTTLNAQPDGTFPGRNSEPTEANVQDLIASVKATGADMGIAWDGDGDRVIFIDEHGKFVIGDRIFALCVQLALKERKGPVVTTVATSNAIKDLAEKHSAKLHRTKVGAPYISEEILKLNGVIGGEEVGGVVWPSVCYGKDGIMTAAKIAEAACKKPLSKLVEGLPTYYNAKTKVAVKPGMKARAMERIKSLVKGKGTPTYIDGVRLDFKNSWVIVRASGTENYLRIFAEAKDEKTANSLMSEYAKIAAKACS